jgi:antitoxin MazE
MQVSKWGNSLAIRLPATVVEALNLKEGDTVEVHLHEPGRLDIARTPTREEWLKRLEKYSGRLPADFKFDRDEANAR